MTANSPFFQSYVLNNTLSGCTGLHALDTINQGEENLNLFRIYLQHIQNMTTRNSVISDDIH